jgi:hypothetical protein
MGYSRPFTMHWRSWSSAGMAIADTVLRIAAMIVIAFMVYVVISVAAVLHIPEVRRIRGTFN